MRVRGRFRVFVAFLWTLNKSLHLQRSRLLTVSLILRGEKQSRVPRRRQRGGEVSEGFLACEVRIWLYSVFLGPIVVSSGMVTAPPSTNGHHKGQNGVNKQINGHK